MFLTRSGGSFRDIVLSAGRPFLLSAIIVPVFAIYVVVSLRPFDFELPTIVDNGAVFLPEGSGLRFESPGAALSKDVPGWVEEAIEDHRWSLDLRLRPFLGERLFREGRHGLARIVTLSLNVYHRNLTIDQYGADLFLRIRKEGTNRNGRPVFKIPNVFEVGRWTDLVVRAGPEGLEVRIDGKRSYTIPLEPRPFRSWDPSYRLTLGNETTMNRPWLGEIRKLEVTTPDGGVINALEPKAFTVPPRYLSIRNFPKLVPFRDFSLIDAKENTLMYVPIGVLLGLRALYRGRSLIAAFALTVLISLAFETMQLFVTVRNPSVDDFLFNSLGGGLGVILSAAMVSAYDHLRGEVMTRSTRARSRPTDVD